LGAIPERTTIKLYTGNYCPYCVRVKRELDRLELNYEEVHADADGREEVLRLSGQRQVPILTIGGYSCSPACPGAFSAAGPLLLSCSRMKSA
jgi:glutaredoxin 3